MLSAHKEIFIKNEVPIQKVFVLGASRDAIQSAINRSVQERHGQSIVELLASEGKSIWGLKDPQLTYHFEALKLFLPQARFIIITRDARAVVRSYIENAWGLGTNCYTGALRWKQEIEMQLVFERSMPEVTLRLRYEDLITDQQRCLEKICEFLNVPYDNSMMNYADTKAFVSKNRQSKNAFKAPDPSIIDKWKAGLSEHQVCVINGICYELLTELGYEVADEKKGEEKKLPGWLKAYYILHQRIIGEIQIQYRWRFGGYKARFQQWRTKKSTGRN
jgi:hypothetical protein